MWSEKIQNLNSSLFVETCFMVCDMVSLDDCSVCTGKNVYSAAVGLNVLCKPSQGGGYCCSDPVCPY